MMLNDFSFASALDNMPFGTMLYGLLFATTTRPVVYTPDKNLSFFWCIPSSWLDTRKRIVITKNAKIAQSTFPDPLALKNQKHNNTSYNYTSMRQAFDQHVLRLDEGDQPPPCFDHLQST
jgi:hypothetical protein